VFWVKREGMVEERAEWLGERREEGLEGSGFFFG